MSAHTQHPFHLRVRDIVRRPGDLRELDLEGSFGEDVGEGMARIAADEPVFIGGRLESVHEGILVTAEADTTADAQCSRCLREFRLPLQIDIVDLFAYDRLEDSDYLVVDDSVDLGPVVRDTAVLALPFQPVCQSDCAGLDPETGERLEPGTQWTPPERIDPRWAALEEFAANNSDAPASNERESAEKE